MRRIGDRFVIEEPLGSGGMGSVHRGRDERLGAPVAIKILRRTLLEDPLLRERFRREALSLGKLRHPGIVTVLDAGEADGELYTVMELVHGETLASVLLREGALDIARAAPIFEQILGALEVCHDNHIVHRDIKPSNVMISIVNGDAHVKLIDFGLARLGTTSAEKLTETGTVQGTPHYMAPEQCRGEEVGPAGDVYSAGVLFYEMLAGAVPFQADDAATFMAQHLFVAPPPLRQVAPRVSAGVSAAVHAALAKQPQDRPSARDLRAALAAAASGTDPEAKAETAATVRQQASVLPRTERAIAGAPPKAPDETGAGGILVWMSDLARSATLRGCLGTAGLICEVAWSGETPALPLDIAVVVVSARDGMDRIGRIHAAPARPSVVVVDIAGPEETTGAIRAGARDMLLQEAPDADLVAKVRRLLKPGARK